MPSLGPATPTPKGNRRPRTAGVQTITLADLPRDRIADERDAIQKRVFTKWMNVHLRKVEAEVKDMYVDLQDGRYLVDLLTLLSGEKLIKEKSGLRLHRMQNVQTCLNFLRSRKIKIVNIRSDDIVDGNPKLTLGLVWIIILHFQVSAVKELFQQEQLSPKEALNIWVKELADGYPGVRIENFSSCWKDGLAFNAVIHRHRPDLIDFTYVRNSKPHDRLEYAFTVAERDLGVHRLLDPEDILVAEVDDKAVITYLSALYKALPTVPPYVRMQNEQERQQIYFDYCTKAKQLITWIRNMISHVNSREFPPTLHAMKDIVAQHKFLKVEVMPANDHKRRSLKYLLRDLQALYDPRIKFLDLAEGLHPRVADELWAELVLAVEERTSALNIELARLEHLQKIADKTEKEADQLEKSLDKIDGEADYVEKKAEFLGQVETKRRHYQLDKALTMFETNVKTLVANVEILLSGRYDEADELQIKIKNLASRWQLLKVRIATIIESHSKIDWKRRSRMSGHQIEVTRDTTVTDEVFEGKVEVEPGVFVDPAELEGYNVQYKTTTTVVTVRSNVTEEDIEESGTTETKTVESIVTDIETPVAVETIGSMEQEPMMVDGDEDMQGKQAKTKVQFLEHALEIPYVNF